MKTGFSSRVCPEWDLAAIVTKAAEFGYDGVELEALPGQTHLPQVSELARDPESGKRLFVEKHLELVALGTAETLDSWSAREVAGSRARILEVVELAGRLGCPLVRVPIGSVPQEDNRHRTLSRVASMFAELAGPAGRQGVTLVVENGGDFPGSQDLWFVLDHVAHPAVAACWNPCRAMTQLERPTISIPRLGTRVKLVHVCDGAYDERGRFGGFRVPGEGTVELGRMVEFLRGIMYRGYLMFDWPKAAVPDLPPADVVLPVVRARLRDWIDTKAPPLSAYEGDKKAVRFNLPGAEAPPPKAVKAAKAAKNPSEMPQR